MPTARMISVAGATSVSIREASVPLQHSHRVCMLNNLESPKSNRPGQLQPSVQQRWFCLTTLHCIWHLTVARNLGSEFNVPCTGNVAMTAVEATLSGSCPHHANKRRRVTLGCMWQDLACTSLLRSRVFLNGSSMFTPKLRI